MAQTEQLNIVVSETGSAGVKKMLIAIATEARKAGGAVKTLRQQVNGKGGTRGSAAEAKDGGKSAAKAHADAVKKSQLAIRKAMIKTANLHANLHRASMNRMSAMAARVKEVIRAEDEKSRLMKQGADRAVREINREAKADMKAMNDRVNAYMRTQDEKSRLMKQGADRAVREINRETKADQKAMNDRVNAYMRSEDAVTRERKKTADAAHRAVESLIKDEKRLQAAKIASGKKTFQTNTDKFVAGKLKQEAKAHDAAAAAARRHFKALHQLGGQSKITGTSISKLSNQVYFAQRAFATLGGYFLIRGFLAMSDAFQNMSNRIRLVTKSTDEYNATQSRLYQISKNTRQSIVSTVETFIRLRKATESQSVPVERLYGAMETINKMLALSGRGAVEAEQAMRQLSQAFSKGKLDGDEFRTVSEAMPSVLTALEKSLGKTRGELRNMSEAGLISTAALLDAFEGVKDQVDKDFGNSVVTLSQSFQLLKDEVFKAIAAFNEESGVLDILQGGMKLLANNIGLVVMGLKLLFYWMVAKAIRGTIMWAASLNKTLIPALARARLMALSLTSPLGLGAKLALGGAAAFATMTIAVLGTGLAFYKLGRVMDDAWDISGKLANAMHDIGNTGVDTGPSTAIGFIKKYKEELVKLREEKKRNLKQGIGGGGSTSTDREIENLKMKIHLHESWIKRKEDEAAAAEQKIIDDAAFHKAMTAYDKLGLKINITRDANVKFNEGVYTASEALKTGVIDADEYAAAVFRLRQQLMATARTLVQSTSMSVDDVFSDQNEVNKIMAEAKAAGLGEKEIKKLGRARLQYEQDLREGRKQIIASGKFNDAEEIENQARKYAKLLRQRRGYEESLEESLADPEKSKKAETDPNIARAAALKALIASLNPVIAANDQLTDAEITLADAEKHLNLSTARSAELRAQFKSSIQDALTPMQAFEQQLTTQAATFGMSSSEAGKYNEALAMQKDLLSKLDNDGKGSEDEVAALVARSQAEAEAAKLNRERLDAIESETAAIVSLHDVKASYDITRQAIIDKEDLTVQERHNLNLENMLKLYPAAAKEIREIDNGIMGLTDHQKKLVKAEDDAKETIQALTKAWKDGRIEVDEYKKAVKQVGEVVKQTRQEAQAHEVAGGYFASILLQTTDTAITMQQVAIIKGVYDDLENAAAEASVGIATAFGRSLAGAEDPWKGFAENMKEIFKDMVQSILADLTKLLIKMAIAAAMKAAFEGDSASGSTNYFGAKDSNNSFGGGGTQGAGGAVKGAGSAFISAQTGGLVPPIPFRHGGTLNTASLPRFAHGGAMQVGGTGGPDTKLVQFMASPGENVRVTNPGQSRMDNKPAPQAAPQVNINNVVDPSQMASAMASPSGKKAILNVIQQDGGTIRRLLG